MTGPAAIQTRAIGVTFGGISVLEDVSVEILPGEIHGLIGENGAGKSTLGKVIGGYYRAAAGSLEVFGRQAAKWDPPTALANGVAMMHQELQLVPELTVAENVFLGLEAVKWGLLRRDEADRLRRLMASSGFELEPGAVVSDLSIADQQKIEILRALARDAQVIVMDEPTSSLSKDEVGQLHAAMKKLRDEGRTVIYVSHFLDDILAVTDRVTALKDGRLVLTAETGGQTRSSLVSAMLGGGKSETHYPARRPPEEPAPALSVDRLCAGREVRDVSLTVGRGEIVGLIGLVGSGRSEIARAVIGADSAESGEVRVFGRNHVFRSPARSADAGMVMVPEDRRRQGLIMTMPVRSNMTLPHLKRFSLGSFISAASEKSRARELIEYFGVRPPEIDGDVSRFSGGNQQKVLFGKWLVENPGIVILDEPSRGVDVGARERIHEAVADLAADGTAVLLISSEIEEVLGLAHRAYLVDRGRIVDEIDPAASTEATVLDALFRFQTERAP